MYFLTVYSAGCSLRPVREPSGQSAFCLTGEADNYAKGANDICSLFHHYVTVYGLGEKTLALHFRNCVGQNLDHQHHDGGIWCGTWCSTGHHSHILVSTMLAGHTKLTFWCDLAGGTYIHQKWQVKGWFHGSGCSDCATINTRRSQNTWARTGCYDLLIMNGAASWHHACILNSATFPTSLGITCTSPSLLRSLVLSICGS